MHPPGACAPGQNHMPIICPSTPATGWDLIPPLVTMPPTEEQVRRKARVLAAFMSSQEATGFARSFALDPAHFLGEWDERKDAGTRIPMGYQPPRIVDLPDSAVPHIEQVKANPEFSDIYGSPAFKMIELGRLIPLQYWMDTDVADNMHGFGHAPPPTEDELLKKCLPLDMFPDTPTLWEGDEAPGRVTFSVYSHNNALNFQHGFDKETGAITFSVRAGANLMCVYEVNGRFILINGYHRAWSLRSRGVAMAPVVIQGASRAMVTRSGCVEYTVLMSDQPPLVDHFLDDQISLTEDVRSTMRVVRVTAEVSLVPRLI